jgi:hypothetical protein
MFIYRTGNKTSSYLDRYKKRVIGHTDKATVSVAFNLIDVSAFNFVNGQGPVSTFDSESEAWEHWNSYLLDQLEKFDVWVIERTFPVLKTQYNSKHYIWHRFAVLTNPNIKWS